jgi:hypothetical protein
MANYDELITEICHAQMSYDAAHEQGCADDSDRRRILDAKLAVAKEFDHLELENGELKLEVSKLAGYLKELRDRYNAKVTNG